MKLDCIVLLLLGCLLVAGPLTIVTADWDDSSSESESSESDDSDDHQRPGRPTPLPRRDSGTPPTRSIPRVFFHDEDFYDDFVDMEDILDNDLDSGERMIVLPSNWTSVTLDDVNDAVEACRAVWCRRYEACVISEAGDPVCQCPTSSTCVNLDSQVLCADNGQTYNNRCSLRVDECAANRLIRILYGGPCRHRRRPNRTRGGFQAARN